MARLLPRNSPQKLLAEHFSGVIVKIPWRANLTLPEEARRVNDHIEIHSEDVDATLHQLIHGKVHLEGLSIHSPDLDDPFYKTYRQLPAELRRHPVMRKFLALLHARNMEFLRDRGTLFWNLLFPLFSGFRLCLCFFRRQ